MKYIVDEARLTSIANAIRGKTGKTAGLTLEQMATEQDAVFDAGKKVEYDRFWDSYQNNGNRTNYSHSFAQGAWTNANFKPKYDIRGTDMGYSFNTTGISGDLAQILEDCDVVLDTSKCTRMDYMFYQAYYITRIPEIDLRGLTYTPGAIFCACSALHTIDKVIVSEAYPLPQSCFRYDAALANIVVEGQISGSLDIDASTAWTHDSLMSFINALQPKSSGTFTLKMGTTNLAKLTTAEKAIATGKGWTLA